MPDESPRPPHGQTRTRGQVVIAMLFGLLALNAWAQVGLVPLGRSDDPGTLSWLQGLVGLTAAAAAWGSWRGARWAAAAAATYGLVTAGMLVALEPLLGLGPDARAGLRIGAATVLTFALGAAWYLRRAARRRAPATSAVPGSGA